MITDSPTALRVHTHSDLASLPTKEAMAQQTATFFQIGMEGAANTQIAYASDIEHATSWLVQHGLAPLPMTAALRWLLTSPIWLRFISGPPSPVGWPPSANGIASTSCRTQPSLIQAVKKPSRLSWKALSEASAPSRCRPPRSN